MDVDTEDVLLSGGEEGGGGGGEADLAGLDVDQLLSEEDQTMEGGTVSKEEEQGTIEEESEEVEDSQEEVGEDGEGGEIPEENQSTLLAALVTALKHKEQLLAVCSIDFLHHHHSPCELWQKLFTLANQHN